MNKYIYIVADTNDADYVSILEKISDANIEKLKPIIKAIKDFKPYTNKGRTHHHNFPTGEYSPRENLGEKSVYELYQDQVGKDVLEHFLELCPYGEYGIHTIKTVQILTITNIEKLL